jgi:hypothetical protein
MNLRDPDLLAIRRRRRQDGRCVQCGAPTPRAALCKACRQTLRYCPGCSAIYPAEQASARITSGGQSAIYCLPCSNVVRNGVRQRRADYLATMRATQHPQLGRIKRLYKQGLTYPQIAERIGMNRGTLSATIAHARKTGRWPNTLRRMR